MGWRVSDIRPYVRLEDGTYSIPDAVMIALYNQIVQEGSHRAVFYGGTVKNAGNWLDLCKRKENVLHTIWENDRPQMIAWLNTWGGNHANAHFCIFKEAWGKNTVELAHKTIDYWFKWKTKKAGLYLMLLWEKRQRTTVQRQYFYER